jgi:hypothetical protein
MMGFAARALLAILLGTGTWFVYVQPLGLTERSPVYWVARGLDAPVAWVGRLSVCPFRPIDMLHPERCASERGSASTLAWHLIFAIPVYVVILYLPMLGRMIRRRPEPGSATQTG